MKLITYKKTVTATDNISTGLMARFHRHAKKLTMTEVAQRMKICKSFLSELENGHRHWTQARLDAFTKACNGR